jgi:hypothetical protein
MVMKDAFIDPHQTNAPHVDLLWKDPGIKDLGKRSTRAAGLKNRVIQDYKGKNFIKIEGSYG